MDSVQRAEASKTTFELVALGVPTLRDGFGQVPVGLGSGKPLALLCYLVVRGEVRRDEAMALLWGDVDEERARNAFRQALHRLRLALGEDVVVGDRQILRIVADHRLTADVVEFERAIDQGRLDDAVALYGGDFLDGFDVGSHAFDEWVSTERARLRARCASAAEQVAQKAMVEGRLEVANAALRKLLAVAPSDGRTRSLRSMLDRVSPAVGAPDAGKAPLFGRTTELARLLAIWNSVGEESGATVIIEGPAGIGKSRLLREFTDSVRALGAAHMLRGDEAPRGFSAPYVAVATALRPLVRAPGVAGASPHLLAEAARLLPELRDAFQLPAVEPGSEDTARLRICEGIAALIEAAAYEQPVCLAIDDVHRASGPTLELLGYLSTRLRRAPVALVYTFDPDDIARDVAVRLRTLAGGAARFAQDSTESHHLSLGRLSAADTTDLIVDLLGPTASRDLAGQLASRANGNALRALELARLAIEGVVPTSLPERTADLIRDRIRACNANERRLLLTASLLGRPAELRLIADASHVGASAAADAAQGLKQRGLLVEVGAMYMPSSESAAEASVDLAGEPTAVFVAGWVAETLARDPLGDPGEVARLFAVAGRIGDTYQWAKKAAERALSRGATEEVVYYLRFAREFARSADERAVVERQLVAHGAGRTQLAPLAEESRPPSRPIRAFVERHFPNWRYLAGAAMGTILVAIILTALGPTPAPTTIGTRDTLVVARAPETRRGLVRFVTGISADRHAVSETMARPARRPAWVDSIGLPWVNAIPSPSGRFVGVERITPRGSNVYLISADRRDTIPVEVGDTEAFGMGWSPDGESFLVARRRNVGSDYQLGLIAFPASRSRAPVPIDTSVNHSVSEATWSPDGSHIGWVARVQGGQEEVFVAWADGSQRRNLSAYPAQDYHVAWSPDGSLLAFTSRRDGNAELYAFDLLGDRLWRLTDDPAQDDRAAFDGDGRFVAFESTRGGASEVYIMPSLSGTPKQVGEPSSSYEIVGWRRSDARYLDRLEISVPRSIERGDTVVLRVRGLDQFDAPIALWQTQWMMVDQGLLRSIPADPDASQTEQRFVALRDGVARVAASVGSWRTDTAHVLIGTGPVALLLDEFDDARSAAWRYLGQPLPRLAAFGGDRSSLVLNADRQWESGVLSSASIPIRAGLNVEATLHAPFEMHAPATTASLALVAPDPPEAVDVEAPRFLRLASITWNADARRFVYAAERELFVEAVPSGAVENVRTLGITVNADGTAAFLVDGVQRWRSTLRLSRAERAATAQVWLGGQDTGARVAFGRVSVTLATPR